MLQHLHGDVGMFDSQQSQVLATNSSQLASQGCGTAETTAQMTMDELILTA